MAIRTQHSLTGFIASDPQLTFTTQGDARLYVRIGQQRQQRNDDGTFEIIDTTYADLIAYRRAAERGYTQFRKGDEFVADGYVRTYDHVVDGHTQQREEFIAKKIGHDLARTTYTIDRTPRQTRSAPGHDNATRPTHAPDKSGPEQAHSFGPVMPAPPNSRPTGDHTPSI